MTVTTAMTILLVVEWPVVCVVVNVDDGGPALVDDAEGAVVDDGRREVAAAVNGDVDVLDGLLVGAESSAKISVSVDCQRT